MVSYCGGRTIAALLCCLLAGPSSVSVAKVTEVAAFATTSGRGDAGMVPTTAGGTTSIRRTAIDRRHALHRRKSSATSYLDSLSPIPTTAAVAASSFAPAAVASNTSSSSSSSSNNDDTASSASSTSAATSSTDDNKNSKKLSRKELIRQEGGRFAFDTKYGALNPFGIYYGLTSIALGIPWFCLLTLYQGFRFVTRGKIDKNRRIPVALNQSWGVALMFLTRCFPKIQNKHILDEFCRQRKAAMFVANHNSWMDIPFVGHTIGWRHYKLVSKAELRKVPILGKAIEVAGNIMVDRANRRSQIATLRQGMQLLKDGIHLCTFPEGTRSRNNHLQKFKNGAFKMAYKAGAPVIPLSIVGSGRQHPSYFMFPTRPSVAVPCEVVIHEPVESEGKTEAELVEQVRDSIITGLPEDQLPLKK